jgi:TolB protein
LFLTSCIGIRSESESASPRPNASSQTDQGQIAYVNVRGGNPEIYVIKPDGTGSGRLVEGEEPRWSPDGTKIAFVRGEASGNGEIFAIGADGTGETNLTENPAGDVHPAWSPDGSRIAFVSGRDERDPQCRGAIVCGGELYVMNADGTGQTRLSTQGGGDPVWSPDGSKIMFGTDRVGNGELYVAGPDGSGEANVTNSPADEVNVPAWSPDGRKILFNRAGACGDPDLCTDLYVMNADGSGQSMLIENSGGGVWSPDGTRIAISAGTGGTGIYVMDADGSNRVLLTSGVRQDVDPVWSPGGREIAFTRFSSSAGIYVVNIEGTSLTLLVDGEVRGLVWSPA